MRLIYFQHPLGWETSAHSYFDGLVLYLANDRLHELTTDEFDVVFDRAASLRARAAFDQTRLTELTGNLTLVDWAKNESAPLAVDRV